MVESLSYSWKMFMGLNPSNACTALQIQEPVAAYFRSYKQLLHFGFAQR